MISQYRNKMWYFFWLFEGPEVRGVRPVLVTFENFKDRDEVLRKARMLKEIDF